MNFLNAKEVVALLTSPPFSLNRPGTAMVDAASNDTIEVVGAGEYTEDTVRALVDPKSTWAKFFVRRKVYFKMGKKVKQGPVSGYELKITSRR